MKILLTGATGYIGKRLLPVLVNTGHKVICCVRDPDSFTPPASLRPYIEVIYVDFLNAETLNNIPSNIDAAYYLIHSMSASNDYDKLEEKAANNFKDYVSQTDASHVIYLSGIVNEENLSKHLQSRKNVEIILNQGSYNLTTLRAGIIMGSGSASFEIIRDLVEKLPVMIAYIEVIYVDFLNAETLNNIPGNIDAAYYLIHSMSASNDYDKLEEKAANNFKDYVSQTDASHVIYLSGIVNEENLSKHLQSRKNVEIILNQGSYNLTTLRAGIIMGSGSASFEIIRDLVEKLPVMIAPKWLNTKCQPIGIRDVIKILELVLFNKELYNKNFDIGGSDILTYKEMLLAFASVRNLKRFIFTVPVLTPKLSSYWLYFVTSTSYQLASSLVNSMRVEVVCRDSSIFEILQITPESYVKSIERAFEKIESNQIVSSWKDAQISGVKNIVISDFIDVPSYGCYKDIRRKKYDSRESVIGKIWSIGGDTGWYYADILWKVRGYIDKLFGGVGLRRGRTNASNLNVGDALDFWRVLYSNKKEGRLLLFAEMKLPGDAWLEFKIEDDTLIQSAIFRPQGLMGRLYWFSIMPLHGIVFNGLINKLTK